MSDQVSDKTAYEKLAKFASAMARGATIEMTKPTGSTGKTCRLGLSGDCVDATYFAEYADIKEIIEPKVLRDWKAEDAKRHVGFIGRRIGETLLFVIVSGHANAQFIWADHEYAAPIPGTDPSIWDWRPCKVEVPAEPVKTAHDRSQLALRELRVFVCGTPDNGDIRKDRLLELIDAALLSLESP